MIGRRGLPWIALLVAVSATAHAEPLKLRVGWAQAPSQLTPLSAELMKRHPGMFRHLGRSYVLEPLFFRGSTPQIQALAGDQLEIASFGPSALVLAITNAHLDMRIVADVMQDGAPGYYSTWWAVRKDGPIKSFTDMAGHRAAINAFGATTDISLHGVMRKHGVADNAYTVIEANFASMLAMMEDGKVDLAPVMPQFNHGFEITGRYRPLFVHVEETGPSQVGMWSMRADVIARNRPALVDFFEDHMRAVRWLMSPANRDEALDIAQAVTKESREALAYVFTGRDTYHSPDLLPNLKAVQNDIEEAVEMKVLPRAIEVAPTYVDLSMVGEAKARLDGK